MNPIDVRTGKQYGRRIALLWGMFGFFGFVITAMAKEPTLGIFGLLLMMAPAYLLWSRRRWWVARMDGDGIRLRSGKRFAWADFDRVVDVRGVAGSHNHYELVFRSGRARVFDRMFANSNEVVAVVQAIERGENPFTGARRPRA